MASLLLYTSIGLAGWSVLMRGVFGEKFPASLMFMGLSAGASGAIFANLFPSH